MSAGYLTRGLLSIHRFAPEVRTALEVGLPFAVARRVNGLRTSAARRRALAPLAALEGRTRGRALPRGLAARIDRLARAEAAVAPDAGAAPSFDPSGWLPPAERVTPPRAMRGDVWAFEPAEGSRARDEPLAERVVEALLARTIPSGGELVDVTAGRS